MEKNHRIPCNERKRGSRILTFYEAINIKNKIKENFVLWKTEE